MKHITTLITLALVLGSLVPLSAQKNMTAKERRAQTRQERKIAQQKENERLHNEAVSVSSSRNFISMANKKATVQVSFDTPRPLQNGLGGFTVEGNVSDVKMKKDKNGGIIYSFLVQGVSISAYVNLSLSPGSNNVSATIVPSFNSNNLTMNGNLIPQEKARVFEGFKR